MSSPLNASKNFGNDAPPSPLGTPLTASLAPKASTVSKAP